MKRRTLLKTLGISAVGLSTVPLWLEAWKPEDLHSAGLNMNKEQEVVLGDLVEVIIPKTDIPGAKELQVDEFIVTLVGDCFDKDVQDAFLAGFNQLDKEALKGYEKSYMNLSVEDKNELLGELETAEKKADQEINFVDFVKQLTVTGYMSSEYVQTKIMKFELVPARFHGSFPVDQSIYRNA